MTAPRRLTLERRFIIAIRSAAANIFVPEARVFAAREAKALPQIFAERMPNTTKGRIARSARQTMTELGETSDHQELREMAQALRAYAAILEPGPLTIIANVTRAPRRAKAESA